MDHSISSIVVLERKSNASPSLLPQQPISLVKPSFHLISFNLIWTPALSCTNSQICLGDSTGVLRTYKTGLKNNTLQLTLIGNGVGHPYGRSTAAVTGIDMRSYSTVCKGQAILVSYEDATFSIYRTTTSVCFMSCIKFLSFCVI